MKQFGLAAVCIAVICVGGCASTGGAPATMPATAVNDGWQPNEVKSAGMMYGNQPISMRRTGTTPSGLSYIYFADGSGSVDPATGQLMDSWSISCGKDRMTDRRECHIRNMEAKILVEFGQSSSPQRVCIIGHDFPGRTGAVRVDSNSAIRTGNNGCVAGSFSQQMASGDKLTVRYVEWPYDYSRDHSALLRGYAEAVDLLRFIKGNIDSLEF